MDTSWFKFSLLLLKISCTADVMLDEVAIFTSLVPSNWLRTVWPSSSQYWTIAFKNLLPALFVASSTFKEKKYPFSLSPKSLRMVSPTPWEITLRAVFLEIVVLSRAELWDYWRSSGAIAKGKQCSSMQRLITALFSLTRSWRPSFVWDEVLDASASSVEFVIILTAFLCSLGSACFQEVP